MSKPYGITSPLLPGTVEVHAFQRGYYRTIGGDLRREVLTRWACENLPYIVP